MNTPNNGDMQDDIDEAVSGVTEIDPYVDHPLTQIENVMFSDCGAPYEGISVCCLHGLI